MRKKETEIELNGVPTKVVMRALILDEIEALTQEFDVGAEGTGKKISMAKKAIAMSVVEPELLKSPEAIGKLELVDFTKMQDVYGELNRKLKEGEKDFLSKQ